MRAMVLEQPRTPLMMVRLSDVVATVRSIR